MFLSMRNNVQQEKTRTVVEELITKKDLAKRLRLCERKVELMASAGEIPVIRIGASIRYNWYAVLNALEASSVQ